VKTTVETTMAMKGFAKLIACFLAVRRNGPGWSQLRQAMSMPAVRDAASGCFGRDLRILPQAHSSLLSAADGFRNQRGQSLAAQAGNCGQTHAVRVQKGENSTEG
jgi:hypothetical protein